MRKYIGFAVAVAAAVALAGCARQPPKAQPTVQPGPAAATETTSFTYAESVSPDATMLRPDAPLRYTVKRGDTLWGISQRFLKDSWQWPEVWYVNPQVRNPHLIYPGDELQLVWVGGQQRVTVVENKLSPRVRELPLDEAIPTIPIDEIRAFLRGPRVVTRQELDRAAYIVEFVDEHLIGAFLDRIYVKNLSQPDYTHAVVRLGGEYRDPDTKELLGLEALPIGEAETRERSTPAIMQVVRAFREARIGDRLLPLDAEPFSANFYPRAPAFRLDGKIIAVFEGMSQIPQYQIVAINRGSDHGLEPGHVLGVYERGRLIADPYGDGTIRLPEPHTGTLMVFKTAPRLSYALVMSADRPMHVLDSVDRPRQALR